ncbi:MAG: phage holin family protein [Eubacterium sp.]
MRELLRVATAVLGGTLSFIFGGFDDLMVVLTALVCLDYLSGVIKGVYRHELSSKKGFYGILKKLMIYLVVSAAYMVQRIITPELPLRDITALFYITNEAISLLENAADFIPIPQKLRAVLIKSKQPQQDKTTFKEDETKDKKIN